jgi:hypothetical protein
MSDSSLLQNIQFGSYSSFAYTIFVLHYGGNNIDNDLANKLNICYGPIITVLN